MDVNKLPVMPAITGNPLFDTLIRSAVIGASGYLAGIITGWLNAHGFYDPNLGAMVGAAIFSTLVALAAAAWGFVNAQITRKRLVATTAVAAATGKVPDSVMAITKPADEPAVTAALNRAQINRSTT